MICGGCGKQEATVFFKTIEDSQVTQRSLCPDCARAVQAPGAGAAPILNLLSMLAGAAPRRAPGRAPACGDCGLSFPQFRKEGRLGCPACYAHFEKPLAEVLASYHGFQEHQGKTPLCSPEAREAIREEVDRAVAREDFEAAARLRDRLQKLREGPGCS